VDKAADQLRRIEGFLDKLNANVCDRVVEWPGGLAYLNASLPKIWDINFLDVHDASLSADKIEAHAEELLWETGCSHRRVRVRDPVLGAALDRDFRDRGWDTDIHVVMAHRRTPNRVIDTSMVQELGEGTWPGRDEQLRTYTFANDDETMRQMRAFYLRLLTAGSGRDFAIVEDGKPVSFALLYSNGDIGQIEDVATLEPYRNRGYSWRVLARVLDESRSRNDLTFLVADERDWPKDFYAKLGFDAVTHHYFFLKRPPDDQGPA